MVKYRPFNDAWAFVCGLGLKSVKEWENYCGQGKRPKDIPYHVKQLYKDDWKGWPDFLGTNIRSFNDVRAFVHTLGLKNWDSWGRYCKSGNKPEDIPSNPWQRYEDDWKNIGDWLGYEFALIIAWKIRTRDEIVFMLNKLGLYLRRKSVNGSFSYCMYWED